MVLSQQYTNPQSSGVCECLEYNKAQANVIKLVIYLGLLFSAYHQIRPCLPPLWHAFVQAPWKTPKSLNDPYCCQCHRTKNMFYHSGELWRTIPYVKPEVGLN